MFWGEKTLRSSSVLANRFQQEDNRRSLGSRIDTIILLAEMNLEFAIVEVSGSPCNLEHTHFVGDRKKISKIKVVGVQIYDSVFYVYS
ncbi:hypothetical protein BC936DRAFT_148351 [Jimgerdemannia flammicorona]|uniref:Uncharacterized protein n=1 Tax=Jimgerdemannia flammicorona TaxID=994334 RepID=A0A433DN41_9FUNG|nr:hypothetical protein BC936DRAFT_148351 [Jimgerdemannia flammicorona]